MDDTETIYKKVRMITHACRTVSKELNITAIKQSTDCCYHIFNYLFIYLYTVCI